MINPKIIKTLEFFNINKDDGVSYLLSLFFGFLPTYIPELIKKQINVTGIVERNYNNNTVNWIIPLFSNTIYNSNNKWDWVVSEYRDMFMKIDPKKGGDRKSCVTKMKQFFSENPTVRKEDVIEATKIYLADFENGKQDNTYLQKANYFISKITKAYGTSNYESRLSEYIELLELEKERSVKKLKANNIV